MNSNKQQAIKVIQEITVNAANDAYDAYFVSICKSLINQKESCEELHTIKDQVYDDAIRLSALSISEKIINRLRQERSK